MDIHIACTVNGNINASGEELMAYSSAILNGDIKVAGIRLKKRQSMRSRFPWEWTFPRKGKIEQVENTNIDSKISSAGIL